MALQERLYDFYLIFHDNDFEKAEDILEHFENEENGGFRGFYPERDGVAGSYITNLSAALEQSRRVFILLSKTSFESGWFKMQLETSLMYHIQEKNIRIIPVYLEQVENIFMSMIIGVSYGEDTFWTRMRKALD